MESVRVCVCRTIIVNDADDVPKGWMLADLSYEDGDYLNIRHPNGYDYIMLFGRVSVYEPYDNG